MLNAASEKKLQGVKPALANLARRASEISKQEFQIVQGARTAVQQRALWNQGRTKPGPVVTWKDGYRNKSNHQGGNAIDFATLVRGKISWQEKYYPAVGNAFKVAAKELKLKIIWGGDWKKRDWGHIELT